MSTWPTVPLGDVLRVRSEIVHPRDSPHGQARFVGLEHIEPHTGRRVGELEIRLEDMTGRRARFHRGDIVYGYLRPYLNKVWVAEFDGLCSVDQYVLRVDPEIADAQFVGQFMRSHAYLSVAPIEATPGQLPRIRIEEILAVPMPCPPVREQRRMASDLALRLGITVLAQLRSDERTALSAALREATIEAAFIDEDGVARREPLGEQGSLQDGDWILNADYAPTGVRLFQVGDVGRGRLLSRSNRYISMERAIQLKCAFLRPGDILISRMPDPIGRACLVPNLGYEAITAVDVTIFRPDPAVIDTEYAVQYMNSRRWLAAAAAKASGATRARISRLNLELLEVPLPTIHVQRKIASVLRDRLSAVDDIEASIRAEQEAMDGVPAALLRRAFGELAGHQT